MVRKTGAQRSRDTLSHTNTHISSHPLHLQDLLRSDQSFRDFREHLKCSQTTLHWNSKYIPGIWIESRQQVSCWLSNLRSVSCNVSPICKAKQMMAKWQFNKKQECWEGIINNSSTKNYSGVVNNLMFTNDRWLQLVQVSFHSWSAMSKVTDFRPWVIINVNGFCVGKANDRCVC